MARSCERNCDRIYGFGRKFLKNCLLSDRSLISQEALWTIDNLQHLHNAIFGNLDQGARDFTAKLNDQIMSTGDVETMSALAAEVLGIYFLFPSNVGRSRKTEVLSQVLEWGGKTLDKDSDLVKCFEHGIGSGGQSYNTRRPFEIGFLIEMALAFKKKSAEDQDNLAGSPWKMMEFLDAIDASSSRQIRHMILHILFPEDFERISSREHKKRIVEAFETMADGSDGHDRQLLSIRKELETLFPDEVVDFYRPPLVDVWNQAGNAADDYIPMAALHYKKQIVLYGPPGTGKTHTAKALAEQIIRPKLLEKYGAKNYFQNMSKVSSEIERRTHRLQLHPAYGYEDFMRGLRITSSGATEYQHGYLPQLVKTISQDDHKIPHVLILDEMNRTDLSRMLGEAFSLLENRGEEITLPGVNAGEPAQKLNIPENLYVIGTMNLIDLSIEQMDFALRRRFLWVYHGFDADALVSAAYSRWTRASNKIDWAEVEPDFRKLASAAGSLNSMIASSQLLGPQYEIGHAYFLDIVPLLIDDLDKRRRQGYLWNTKGAPRRPVEQLWEYALFPLLQEYLVSIDPQSRAKVLSELRKAFVSEPVAEA